MTTERYLKRLKPRYTSPITQYSTHFENWCRQMDKYLDDPLSVDMDTRMMYYAAGYGAKKALDDIENSQ